MDSEFDPSADLLVHDFDDERTLDEEEAMYPEDDSQAELSSLQKEQDMPLADILASYGIKSADSAAGQSGPPGYFDEDDDDEEEEEEEEEEAEDEEEEEEGDETGEEDSSRDASTISLQMLYKQQAEVAANAAAGLDAPGTSGQRMHLLRSVSHQSDEDDEEDDCEYIPDEKLPWKKTVNVGSDFQAQIPPFISPAPPNPAGYYPDETERAELLWMPGKTREPEVAEYLRQARSLSDDVRRELQGIAQASEVKKLNVPSGVVKDNEKALTVLRECKYNTKEALARWRDMVKNDEDHDFNLWSEEETRQFENGLLQYGKDFFKLHHFVVRTRSRAELVEYYYFWKKSLRHDIAVSRMGVHHRLEKKKFALNPNTTEMMDLILDEQQQNAWPGTATATNSLLLSPNSSSNLNSSSSPAPNEESPKSIVINNSANHGRTARQTVRVSGEASS